MEMMRVAAEIALDRQDLDRAKDWISAYGRWANWCERLSARATHGLLASKLAFAHGDLDLALSALTRVVDLATAPRSNLWQSWLRARLEGEIAIRKGEVDAAMPLLNEAHAIAQSANAPYELARCKLAIMRAERAGGDTKNVESLVREVRDIAESLGAAPLLVRA